MELAGYEVWHDLARLKGGDYFWDKIEKAIRYESFRMLAVVSEAAVAKVGVQDEWALGLVLEKSNPGFVIPITVDHFDFSQLPINLGRKNAIDFGRGWHKGLQLLLETLSDSKAPRVADPDARSIRRWLPELEDGAVRKTQDAEQLDSTWLRVKSLPPALETARFLGSERQVGVTAENGRVPWFEHENRIVGFTKSSDLVQLMSKSAMLQKSTSVDLQRFIAGETKFDGDFVRSGEARKRVTYLMRLAWELTLEARGYPVYFQANQRKVHYVAADLTRGLKGKVPFADFDGRTRRRGLNGQSQRRGVNWFYGVSVNPTLDEPRRIELRPTIVFTDFDGTPLDAVRQQRLRMSFCRNWWNDRWRGFLRAFLTLVSEGQPEIRLPVGSERFLILDSTPIAFESASGLSDGPPAMEDAVTDDMSEETDAEDYEELEGSEGMED